MARLRYDLKKVPELEQVPMPQRAALEKCIVRFHLTGYLIPDFRFEEGWKMVSSEKSWSDARDKAAARLDNFKIGREGTHSAYTKNRLLLLAETLGRLEAAERIHVIAGNEGANALISNRLSSPSLPTNVIGAIAQNEWKRDAALIGVAHLLTDHPDGKLLFEEVMRTRMIPWSKGYGVIGTAVPSRSATSIPIVYYMRPTKGPRSGPVRPQVQSEASELADAISSSRRAA